ncbi:MAG: N-acetylmuramoyl-L-alanine amidase [Crocinitomicaceae bacterium]|nr:N-acetylmuramoyl-L-alanine amidase [Crocinitomicaceae bacterium]
MNMHCAKLPILREFKKNDFLLKLLVLLVVLFTCSKSFPLYSQQIKTVVIDAGHGGKDPGCHGNFAFEKEVCLSMALKLGSLIKAKYPEIKIIYTRDKDVFVELIERANIANRAKADLFICIHANAEQTKAAFGYRDLCFGSSSHRSSTESC